ncbi:MAG: glycosyltransferase family 4 protein [Candidatus Yanofskybacteria bacterium]|nr:glycosyltransferase family 4 protein [Candidatus Yanofskybacteria bacterium]
MIIGIDIRVLGYSVKSGIEEYAENLIPLLIKEGGDIQFKLFYSSSKNKLPNYSWLKEKNVELHTFNYSNNLLFTSARFLNRPFIDKMVGGADVFFFPHFFLSSLSPSCKRVTTFHDLSYVHFPERLTLRKKIWHSVQMNPKWQAKFSDKLIAVSESTKNDLVNFYKVDPARVEVIHSGALLRLNLNMRFNLNKFKREKNLPDRFILFLGKLEPRKNTVGVIRAFNNLKSNPKYNDVGLVIAGAKGWKCDDLFREANVGTSDVCWTSDVVNSCDVGNIIFTGQINDEERSLYYRAADVFVYPSFFEGFGFPPLEAMVSGIPVITSRNSSLPEVVGDAAIMIDPYDISELELWVTKLLDKDLANLMVKKGIEQSSKFNWRSTATKTLETLIRAKT